MNPFLPGTCINDLKASKAARQLPPGPLLTLALWGSSYGVRNHSYCPCCEEAEVSQVETPPGGRNGYFLPAFNSLMMKEPSAQPPPDYTHKNSK